MIDASTSSSMIKMKIHELYKRVTEKSSYWLTDEDFPKKIMHMNNIDT